MPTRRPKTSGPTRRRSSDSRPSKRSAARRSPSAEPLFTEWSEFLRLLTRHRVRFLLIGGHAIAVHGHPRHTEGLDVFVAATTANARRLRAALDDFGFGAVAPSIFDRAWSGRITVELAGTTIPVIGREALVANKRAAGRPKDELDLLLLGTPRRRRRERD